MDRKPEISDEEDRIVSFKPRTAKDWLLSHCLVWHDGFGEKLYVFTEKAVDIIAENIPTIPEDKEYEG